MALLTWVLSLGPLLKVNDEVVTVTIDIFPTYVPLPWLGAQYVPVLNLARTPARFNLALGVMVAVMAAYGLAHPLRYMRWRAARWSVVVALVPLIFFESAVWWEGNRPHLQTVPDLRVEAITALREDNRVRAVLNLPYDHPVAAKQGMYLQTRHQTPLIAGHVTRRTPVTRRGWLPCKRRWTRRCWMRRARMR